MIKFAIVVPSYNNAQWYKRNIQSIISQDYQHYRVLYIDDCSTDGTGQLVSKIIPGNSKFNLQINNARKGAMQNLYEAIHSCEDNEVIVTLDGDDWLAHNAVLSKLNSIYSSNDKVNKVWMTWGSYMDHPGRTRGCSKPIPENIIKNRSYRRAPWMTSHLRTFYKWLFAKISKEDFYDPGGKFFDVAWDLSFMLPMLEMSGRHGRYINEFLYIYNNENPIQDYKIKLNRQAAMDRYIRSKPMYPAL